ncbi:hypothetical protein IAU60_003497 [Kwoniella sp. DSM 27419]
MSSHSLPLALAHITLLISNMHCTSCCETIAQLLSGVTSIKSVSTSLLLHTVTFAVDTSAGPSTSNRTLTVRKVVQDAMGLLKTEGGFEVMTESADGKSPQDKDSPRTSGWLSKLGLALREPRETKRAEERRQRHLENCQVCQSELAGNVDSSPVSVADKGDSTSRGMTKTTLSIEGMTCASCVNSITTACQADDAVISVSINLLGSSGVIQHTSNLTPAAVAGIIEDVGFDAQVIKSEPIPDDVEQISTGVKYKSTYAIEGMTCASCSGVITTSLSGRPGIESVHIDLLGHAGVVVHTDEVSVDDIAEMIEDIGYGAELSSSEPVTGVREKGKGKASDEQDLRTVRIRIEGMFCHDCVRKVNAYLDQLPVQSYTPITLNSPIITVSYRPHGPLTIRALLEGIQGVAPEFEAELVKSQSLSEKSRMIQKREFKLVLWHCLAAVLFAIPTFVIGIVGMTLASGHSAFKMDVMKPVWGSANLATVILWPLATIVQFGVGRLFYKRTFASLWPHLRRMIPSSHAQKNNSRRLSWRTLISFGSMDLLVVLSTSVSYFASLAMLIIDVRAQPGTESIGTYFDSGVFIIMFILLGRTLEAYAKSRTTDAISVLGTLRPATAVLIGVAAANGDGDVSLTRRRSSEDTQSSLDSEEATKEVETDSTVTESTTIPVDHLEIGDIIMIAPGSLPPTDGIQVSGHTTFDESSLTGESRPITKTSGDEIFTGTVNLSSAISIRVTQLAENTMLERIIAAVSDASARKAPLELIAEKLTGVFVPIIVYFALAVLAVWLTLSLTGTVDGDDKPGGKVFFALEFAIACLVVACPCGIGLAVPCANAVGNGVAAKAGILASGGGQAFLAATKVDQVVFDKTGTLTVGKSVVTDQRWLVEEAQNAVAKAITAVERGSTHPLAVGLVEYLEAATTTLAQAESQNEEDGVAAEVIETVEIAGRGLIASVKVSGETMDLLIGNVAHMADHAIELGQEKHDLIKHWSSEAKSVVLVATRQAGGMYALLAMFALSDPPRPSTAPLIALLRERGVGVSMLSGDNEITARAVGAMVGLKEGEVTGGVGPEGKAEAIRDMQGGPGQAGQRRMVMFVGDGLNDAVALAAADVSVAMGHGSQATLASADFVLLSSDLQSLVPLLHISRKVILRQRLNLLWALMFNVICLPFAAGVFYAAGGIRLTPVWSAVLMALSSVSVVSSSLAMRWGW